MSLEVIQISNHSPSRMGAFEMYSRALAMRVRESGGTSDFFYFRDCDPWFVEWMANAGATAHSFPYEWSEPREKPWRIASAIKRIKPPGQNVVVHVQFPILSGIAFALRIAGYRNIVLTDQLSGIERPLAPHLHFLRRAANNTKVLPAFAVTAMSSFVRDRHLRIGIPGDKTRVIYIGVDTGKYAPATPELRARLRGEFGIGIDEFVICFAGRVEKFKGLDTLARAFGKSLEGANAQQRANCRLIVAGDGAARSSVESQVIDLGIADRTIFLGRKEDIVPILQMSDTLVCPSLWEEAFGYVNIEAMAVGLPVIASRVGGISEIIDNGVTGFLVDAGDSQSICACLNRLRDDLALREQMGAAGRARVFERFNVSVTIDRTMALYAEMVH